jgi:hypothetical protein
VLAAGAAQTLSVTFTPTDAANYTSATASVAITVLKATPLITWPTPADIVYGTALSATQLNATANVPGAFVYTPAAGEVLAAGAAQTLSVTFTPADAANYTTATASVAITVLKATPVITWPTPADIIYGAALSTTQLNATANVAGSFVYSPAAGTILNAGAAQTLSVTFAPTDAANYTPATASVAITVLKATPTLTWSTPADITYGTALSASQLNATANLAGTFVYTPASGTVLSAGAARTLSVTFTPTDANYASATASVAITVLKATPIITWPPPADIVFGTALSATQLNATTTVPGTFVYTPAAGTVLSVGVAQTLSVTFTPTDAANYTSAALTVLINLKPAPSITVSSTTVTTGGTVTATVTNGPGNRTDWVALYPASGTYVDWKYLNGSQTAPATGVTEATVSFTMPTTPGTYTLRFNAGATLLATSATITVAAPAVTLTLDTTTASTGGIVVATVANGPGQVKDWIGLYATGGSTLLDWKYLNGSQVVPVTGVTGASVAFTMPTTSGSYTLKFFTGTSTLLATSATITVTSGASLSFVASPTTVAAAGVVTATVSNGPGAARDWIGLYNSSGSLADWKYLNGSQTAPATGLTAATVPFTMPTTLGTYTMRFNSATNTVLATSATITVAPPSGATISASPTVIGPGGTVTVTVAGGPANKTDWIGFYAEGASTYLEWKYLNGLQTAPAAGMTGASVSFTMPAALGNYTFKFWAGSTLLATSSAVTVGVVAPSVTVSTTTAVSGGTIAVTVANGPAVRTDWVGVYPTGGGTYVDWKYLNGTQAAPATGLAGATFNLAMPTAPGTYFLRFMTGNTVLATSQTITVSASAVSLTVSPSPVAPGGTVTATVANGPANKTDWVALYPEGETGYLTWKYLNGLQTAPATGMAIASVPFTMPTTPGNYVIKFWAGPALLATSATVTVGSNATVTVTPTTIGPLGTISVTVGSGPGNATDWVALYATGSSTYLDWKYLNGLTTAPAAGMSSATVTFVLPETPGTYVVKFLSAGTVLATSQTITVLTPTVTASATTVAMGDTVTATVANGAGNPTDWIGLYLVNGPPIDWNYLNGSKTAPASGVTSAAVPFVMPTTPGIYELRFYAGSILLATSQAITVQ